MLIESNNKISPPILPYRTFLSSFERLSETIPPRIDRGIWKNQTGTVQSLIMSTYRFFGLIDEQSKPTKRLQELVADREKPNEQIKALLTEKYAEVIKHDLSSMTEALINDYFESAFDVQGDTKRKAITFFLQAAKAVGMPLSTFLQTQVRVRTTGSRRAKRRDDDENGADEINGVEQEPPSGNTKTIELRSGGTLTITVSVDVITMSSTDRDFVFKLIDSLNDYEQRQKQADAIGKASAGGQNK